MARIERRSSSFIVGISEQSERYPRRSQGFGHPASEDDWRIVSRIHIGEFAGIPVQEQEDRRCKETRGRMAAEVLINLLGQRGRSRSSAGHASNQRLYVRRQKRRGHSLARHVSQSNQRL